MLTKTIIENVLIIAAEGFWILSNSSQLLRLLRTRNRRGLSAPNQTLNAAGNIAWVAYFASRHLYVPVVTNLMMFVITLATLAYTLGNRKHFTRGVVAIAIIGPLTSFILIKYAMLSGWLGVAYNVVATSPWLVHVIRTKKASGISRHSLLFVYGANLCTFTYAALIVSVPLMTGTVIGFITISIIFRYYRRYRHR